MKLTFNERLILANQYKILALLNPDDQINYERAQQVIESGYEGAYTWYGVNIDQNTVSEEECSEVTQILNMFSSLKYCYEKIEEKDDLSKEWIYFRGFDTDTEIKQWSFANFLHETGKWSDLNWDNEAKSWASVLPKYRRMLSAWNTFSDPLKLTKEQLQKITSA